MFVFWKDLLFNSFFLWQKQQKNCYIAKKLKVFWSRWFFTKNISVEFAWEDESMGDGWYQLQKQEILSLIRQRGSALSYWRRFDEISRNIWRSSRLVNLQTEPQQWLHWLCSGDEGEITTALWKLPAARVHHGFHTQQSQIWTQVRTW